MINDIKRCDEIITNITNEKVEYFRPPFGVTNPLLKGALKHFSYKIIGWNIRSFDTTRIEENKIIDRVKKQIKPGSIILLHDRLVNSDTILNEILLYLNNNNYTIKRVDKLLNFNS